MMNRILGILFLVASLFLAQKIFFDNDVSPTAEIDDTKPAGHNVEEVTNAVPSREIISTIAVEESDSAAEDPDSKTPYSEVYEEYLQRANQGDADAKYILSIFVSGDCPSFLFLSDDEIDELLDSGQAPGRSEATDWMVYRDCIQLQKDISAETRLALRERWLEASADSGFGLAQLHKFQAQSAPVYADETRWREYTDLVKSTFDQMQNLNVSSEVVSNMVNEKYYESLASYFLTSDYRMDRDGIVSSSDDINYGIMSLVSLRCDVDPRCSSGALNKLQEDFSPFEIDQIAESKERIKEIIESGQWEDLVAETAPEGSLF